MVTLATEQPFLAIIILTLVIVLTALGIVYFVVQKRNGNGSNSISLLDKVDRIDKEIGDIRDVIDSISRRHEEKLAKLELDLKVGFLECGGILKNMDRSIGIINKSIERLVNVFGGGK